MFAAVREQEKSKEGPEDETDEDGEASAELSEGPDKAAIADDELDDELSKD